MPYFPRLLDPVDASYLLSPQLQSLSPAWLRRSPAVDPSNPPHSTVTAWYRTTHSRLTEAIHALVLPSSVFMMMIWTRRYAAPAGTQARARPTCSASATIAG